MQKKIIAFSYILIKMAEEYINNIIEINNKEKRDKYDLKYKLQYFNYENDFSQVKCSLFPFLVTVANGDKKELNEFFENFLPLQNGFIQPDLLDFILFKSVNEQDVIPVILNIFTFQKDSLKIDSNFINNIDEKDIAQSINIFLYKNDINNMQYVDINTIARIDNSINHLNKAVKYFPNRFESHISYLSKDNTPYRKFSFLFDSDTKGVKSNYKDISKDEIVNRIKTDYMDSNYKFPLTPAQRVVSTTETSSVTSASN